MPTLQPAHSRDDQRRKQLAVGRRRAGRALARTDLTHQVLTPAQVAGAQGRGQHVVAPAQLLKLLVHAARHALECAHGLLLLGFDGCRLSLGRGVLFRLRLLGCAAARQGLAYQRDARVGLSPPPPPPSAPRRPTRYLPTSEPRGSSSPICARICSTPKPPGEPEA